MISVSTPSVCKGTARTCCSSVPMKRSSLYAGMTIDSVGIGVSETVRCASTRASSSGVFTPTASMSSVAAMVTTVPCAAACGMNGRKLRSPVTASAVAVPANAGRSTIAAWADSENSPMSLSPRAGMTCPSRRCLTPTMRPAASRSKWMYGESRAMSGSATDDAPSLSASRASVSRMHRNLIAPGDPDAIGRPARGRLTSQAARRRACPVGSV